MRIRIELIQKDLLSHEQTVIADGMALWNDHQLIYTEKETGYKHKVIYTDEEIILERSGEFSSRTVLTRNRKGTSIVSSPFGKMYLETDLLSSVIDEHFMKVHYRILQNSETVSEFELVWNFFPIA